MMVLLAMSRSYILLAPLTILLALGILVSSTNRLNLGDSSLSYVEGRVTVPSYVTARIDNTKVLGEATTGANNVVVEFLASFLIWFMWAGVAVLWFIDGKIKKEQVLHALVAATIAWVISEALKQLFHTPRPFVVNGLRPLTATVPSDPAFPSTHAAAVFALATTIWFHDRKVGIFFVVAAVVVGVARILANVHYPEDILAGAIIGSFAALLVERVHFPLSVRKT
ncbi:MAG TPA: phosphatase PAP2 family protein [Patescibacteria group bacterium]